jgi:CDP-diacylglycerol--glycerol-3-phosphate 3-phosphatidyltransferase
MVSKVAAERSTERTWNLPNQVTALRLIVSLFVFLAFHFEWFVTALVLFLVAASTDWVDGQLARRYGQVTQLGRIMDPLADKIVICGSFIFLAAEPDSRIAAWMAVVVVGRELVVTVIRSFLEQSGKDFSANMPGKLKMVFQCAAVAGSLWLLHTTQVPGNPWPNLPLLVTGLVWLAVLSTVYSGIIYIIAAARLVREI